MKDFSDAMISEYESDIYEYETEEDAKEYVSWLKNIGAWDQLTDDAQKEVLSVYA